MFVIDYGTVASVDNRPGGYDSRWNTVGLNLMPSRSAVTSSLCLRQDWLIQVWLYSLIYFHNKWVKSKYRQSNNMGLAYLSAFLLFPTRALRSCGNCET
jgi:hypothetical protein